jgi:hypothetical protein
MPDCMSCVLAESPHSFGHHQRECVSPSARSEESSCYHPWWDVRVPNLSELAPRVAHGGLLRSRGLCLLLVSEWPRWPMFSASGVYLLDWETTPVDGPNALRHLYLIYELFWLRLSGMRQ